MAESAVKWIIGVMIGTGAVATASIRGIEHCVELARQISA